MGVKDTLKKRAKDTLYALVIGTACILSACKKQPCDHSITITPERVKIAEMEHIFIDGDGIAYNNANGECVKLYDRHERLCEYGPQALNHLSIMLTRCNDPWAYSQKHDTEHIPPEYHFLFGDVRRSFPVIHSAINELEKIFDNPEYFKQFCSGQREYK